MKSGLKRRVYGGFGVLVVIWLALGCPDCFRLERCRVGLAPTGKRRLSRRTPIDDISQVLG
jgi:hypothetical protein